MMFLTLLLVTVALFAMFWGGSLIIQGYLYNQPADRLPLRALAAALLVGSFLIFWIWVDKRSPGKYETFFNVEGEESTQFTEFEALRLQPVHNGKQVTYKPEEVVSKVKKAQGATGEFIDERTGKPFMLSGSFPPDNLELVTVAMVVKDDAGNPTRFSAAMDVNPQTGEKTYSRNLDLRRFVQEKGDRYIEPSKLGSIFVPRTVFWALALNAVHYVIWFAAFWPILRFNWGHALLFAAAFGLATMMLLMPLLFKQNRKPAAPATALVIYHREIGTSHV
jgi:hypothetical protein